MYPRSGYFLVCIIVKTKRAQEKGEKSRFRATLRELKKRGNFIEREKKEQLIQQGIDSFPYR